ncbi:CheR family methyltransferase [Pelagibacterium montanilacus]|uniref:CheR family methyltransferase n=1 Tax=Pelagibacterium montanilacus TaxID=2185280 RepID=UPI000F8F12C7|nr:CheR family methyltransferase [Pelagibacterium montanilacus]
MKTGEMALSDADFARVRARLRAAAGISLSDAKRTLVISRLSGRIRRLGLSGFAAYLDYLDGPGGAGEAQIFVNALTTNLTRFFREDHHFDHLVATVKALAARPARRGRGGRPLLRIWSAGCSTGQEPYTIALSLLDGVPSLADWDFRILATDVDTDVLEKAGRGIYPESELDGLSPARRALFDARGDGTIAIPPAAREIVVFRQLNLMEPWPFAGPFDAIFCRNVAIYFDKSTQTGLFARMGAKLTDDGHLYIGHSETLHGVARAFRLVGKTTYQRNGHAGARSAA